MKESTGIILIIVWGVVITFIACSGIDKSIKFEDTKLEQSLSEANRKAIVSSWK